MEDDMTDGVTQQTAPASPPRRATGPGMTIPRLTFPEQLVLWSARRLATAGHESVEIAGEAPACRRSMRARVAAELDVALGSAGVPAAGREAAETLERTLDIFALAGERGLGLNPLCCRFVSNGERLFLSFLAACQEGDYRHACALLSWFLPPAAIRAAATDGAAFAAALQAAGYLLPQRFRLASCTGFPRATPVHECAPRTLH